MENKADKDLKKFTEKIMNEVSPETPSFGFEQRLMRQLVAAKSKFHFKPLFSVKQWLIIGLGLISLAIGLYWADLHLADGWFATLQEKMPASSVASEPMSISTISLYALGFFFLVIVLQTIWLKRLFEKRLK